MKNKVTGFRLSSATLEHLDALCRLSDANRSEFMTTLIEGEYDKVMGNPKLKALLEQMQVLRKQFLDLSGAIETAGDALPSSDNV